MPAPIRERGAHLLDAALAVVAEDGFGAVSMRSVAARAEVSLAQVQYYFGTKAGLITAAFDQTNREFLATLGAPLPGRPSLDRLRSIIWLWLPLDEEREKRARVWLAYAATAATDAELAVKAAALDVELKRWFTEQLTDLQRAGHAAPQLDAADTAAQLLALIDGITVHCLMVQMEARPALAERTLGNWLNHLNYP